MLKGFIEKALVAEMSEHLSNSPEKNKRNGKGSKTLKTNIGSIEIATPTDRISSFEPSIVKKRQTILADNLSEKIIGLYGLGMSLRDICSHNEEIYDI
jgi:putative transposase